MNDELVDVMGSKQAPLAQREDGNPTVILMAGLQGAGKTTASAKLAKCVPEFLVQLIQFCMSLVLCWLEVHQCLGIVKVQFS